MYHRRQHFPQVDSEVCFQRFFPAFFFPARFPAFFPCPIPCPLPCPASCRWQYIHIPSVRCVFEFSMAFYLPYVIRSFGSFGYSGLVCRMANPFGKSSRQFTKARDGSKSFQAARFVSGFSKLHLLQKKNRPCQIIPAFQLFIGTRNSSIENTSPNEAWNSDRMGGHGGSKGDLMSSGAFQDFAVVNYNGKDRRQAVSAYILPSPGILSQRSGAI